MGAARKLGMPDKASWNQCGIAWNMLNQVMSSSKEAIARSGTVAVSLIGEPS